MPLPFGWFLYPLDWANDVEVWRNAGSGDFDIYFFSPAAKLISGQLKEVEPGSVPPPRQRQGFSSVEL